MTHGKSVNKVYGYSGCWKRSGPTRIKVRIQKEESQRFKDPKEIHGSQRQMKNVGNAWVENRCLRPEGRIMNPIRVEDTDSHPTQENDLDKRQDPCIKKFADPKYRHQRMDPLPRKEAKTSDPNRKIMDRYPLRKLKQKSSPVPESEITDPKAGSEESECGTGFTIICEGTDTK